MGTILKAGSDAATFVLYDPRAMAHRIATPPSEWFDTIEADGAAANALVFLPGGDGEEHFEIFVDEEPPPERIARAQKHTGHLKVPSGRLFFTGVEYIEETTIASPLPESTLDLGVGGYDVDVYATPYGPTEEEAAASEAVDRAHREAAAVAEPRGHRLSQLRWALFGVTLLPLTTGIALLLLVYCLWNGLVGDLFRTNLKWAYAGIVAAWVVFWLVGRAESVQRYERAADPESPEDDTVPPVVVVLRRRSEPPEVWKGICFGA